MAIPSEYMDKLNRFRELLLEANEQFNLTRITDPEEIYVRHWEDSMACLPILKQIKQIKGSDPFSLIDIGSGAGIPALALAIVLPNWQVVSVEATGKKAEFQQFVAEDLGLTNVEVFNGRAEKLAHLGHYREQFDVVTARAVGHMRILAELTIPFAKIGGKVLAWKGRRIDEELPEARKTIQRLGASIGDQVSYTLPNIGESGFCIVVLDKAKPTPRQHPREFKDIKAKPL